jgi:hypothetical protein
MRHGTINAAWFAWSTHRRLDAGFWLDVQARLSAAGHDPQTAGEAEVRAAIQAAEQHAQQRPNGSEKVAIGFVESRIIGGRDGRRRQTPLS